MKKIQYIYTFDTTNTSKEVERQTILNASANEHDLSSKPDLIANAINCLTDEEKQSVIKISCCLEADKDDCPEWFLSCNGKIWLDDLENYRESERIESIVDMDHKTEWYSNNV